MLHVCERRPRTYHAVASLEQRLIVGLAVVCDQHIEALQILGERRQQRRLFPIVAHEKLPHPKTGLVDTAHADQKRVGSRSTREARSFGIEKSPARRM